MDGCTPIGCGRPIKHGPGLIIDFGCLAAPLQVQDLASFPSVILGIVLFGEENAPPPTAVKSFA